jgi:hypothetical protein
MDNTVRGHVKLSHDGPCDAVHCNICDLFTCSRCGASEGEMPFECPGIKMTVEQKDAVMDGKLDYRGGDWIQL